MSELPSIHVATEKTPASDEKWDCTVSKFLFSIPSSNDSKSFRSYKKKTHKKTGMTAFSPQSINIYSHFIQSINSQLAWKQKP